MSPATLHSESTPVADWRRLKFGLMLHWGVYSVAGGVWQGRRIEGYNEQIKHRAQLTWDAYRTLDADFTASAWDTDAIAQVASDAGMRYVVITTKHHDGFCLWDTHLSDYNAAAATPAARDLLTPLAASCARQGLGLGFYYSLIDWHYPGAYAMSERNSDPLTPALEAYTLGQLRELLTGYGPVCELWFDMGKPTPEQSRTIAGLVRSLQPTCLVNGRIWNGQHDFMECNDNERPNVWFDAPWESSVTMFHDTWGYRSWQVRDSLAEKVREKVRDLAFVTAKGGNYLLNIGPRGDGSLHEFDVAVLKGIGEWMRICGEAIHDGEPEPFFRPDFGCVTRAPGRLWLYVAKPPADGVLRLPGWLVALPMARVLGDGGERSLTCSLEQGELCIRLPADQVDPRLTVVVLDHVGSQPYLPTGVLRVSVPQPSRCTAKNALTWQRMDGGDYYSLRKFVTRRTWQVLADNDGDYDLVIHRVDGGDARGFLVSAASWQQQFILPEARAPQRHASGRLTLSAGIPLAIELTDIVPGRELADAGIILELIPV